MNTELRALGAEGVLREDELPDLGASRGRVLKLMLDHQWHCAAEIRRVAGENGVPASEGLRRMRELRARGYTIEKRRRNGSRHYEYRLKSRREAIELLARIRERNAR